jgi:hypothetical protein
LPQLDDSKYYLLPSEIAPLFDHRNTAEVVEAQTYVTQPPLAAQALCLLWGNHNGDSTRQVG